MAPNSRAKLERERTNQLGTGAKVNIKSILQYAFRYLLIICVSISFKKILGLTLHLLHVLRVKRYGSNMLHFKTAAEFDYDIGSLAFNARGDMIAGSGLAATGLIVCNTSDGKRRAFFKYSQALQLSNAIAWGAKGVIGYPHAASTELRLARIGNDGTTFEKTVAIEPFVKCEYVSFSPSGDYAAMPGRVNHKVKAHNKLNNIPNPDVLIIRVQTGETYSIATGYRSEKVIWLSETEIVAIGHPYPGGRGGDGLCLICFNVNTKEVKEFQFGAFFGSLQITKDIDTRTVYVYGWQEKGFQGCGASTIWCLTEGLEGEWVVQKKLSIPWNSDGDAKCYALEYSIALKRLVALIYDETQKPLRLIDPDTGEFEGVYVGGIEPNNALAVSHDGRQVAIAVGGSARVFEVQA